MGASVGYSQNSVPTTKVPSVYVPLVGMLGGLLQNSLGQKPQYPGVQTAPLSMIQNLALGNLVDQQLSGANKIAPTTGTQAFGGAGLEDVFRSF